MDEELESCGIVNLLVVRNSTGQITAIESISEEQAQKLQSKIYKYRRDILNGLDEKVAERVKKKFSEN